MRAPNEPIEIWVDRGDKDIFFLVLAKTAPTSQEPHEVWDILASSPDDGLIMDQAYAENIQEAATMVWREEDGLPLPAKYHIEMDEEDDEEK